jgi:chloramphenicol 3-O phosphotransferase
MDLLFILGKPGRSTSAVGGRTLKRPGTAAIAAIAAIVASGTGVIVDEVFLGGRKSQERLRVAFGGLGVLWVGVKCNREIAKARRPCGQIGFQEWLIPRQQSFTRASCTT